MKWHVSRKQDLEKISQSVYRYSSKQLSKKSSIAPNYPSESLVYTGTSNFKRHSITNLKVLLTFLLRLYVVFVIFSTAEV